ncbi:tyrosine-type recombinase/integrase [Campylobacter blaseri]|uniref:tyrosine-type recombinase/integrase n=1 Tax=Campylobacter blaseri TaxID=2042961 RepID=UPI001F4ED609|nr:site-specific integrase [Campylobacter blaseri]
MINRINLHIMPSLENMDVKNIKSTMLRDLLNPLFNRDNPSKSRLETIHRTIRDLKTIFSFALRDGYITIDPTIGLANDFPTSYSFAKNRGVDTRLPAIIDESVLKEFLIDLKNDNSMDLQTKRAVYLQILTTNRPINTAEAKWKDIDLENKIWTISAEEMKTNIKHTIGLSSYVVDILKEQYQYSKNSKFVFPSVIAKDGHIHRDAISKAMRNLGYKDKYKNRVTAHGFRATFKTICTLNLAELLKIGITREVIEGCLAHKEHNKIIEAYQREKTTINNKIKLMQWYGDYLNKLEGI